MLYVDTVTRTGRNNLQRILKITYVPIRSAVGPIFFQLYRQLDLVRFYTIDKYMNAEEDEQVREVKIWFCQQGTYAPEAAGRILTDMER